MGIFRGGKAWCGLGMEMRPEHGHGAGLQGEMALMGKTAFRGSGCATVKPRLEAEGKKERVEIMARKLGADSLNIYSRKRGEAGFLLIAAKRKRFPFEDDAPPADATKPEEREYQAIAVVDDEEVGIPSDIITAVWRP